MIEFGRKALIELAKKYLSAHLGGLIEKEKFLDFSDRTINFYQTENLLNKPKKSGRDAVYSSWNLKQLIAIKLLQSKRADLKLIKRKVERVDETLLDYGASNGITPEDVDKFVESEIELINQFKKPIESETGQLAQKMEEVKIMPAKKNRLSYNYGPVTVSVTNQQDYNALHDRVRLGTSFAFLYGLDDEMGGKLHRLIHGQKNGKGTIKNAIIPVDDDGFELPGCTVRGSGLNRDMAILISDKDVYKEGVDVAQLFLYDPTSPNETRKIDMYLDYLKLDTLNVNLDSNGCGVVRYATISAGKYEARLQDSEIKRSFEASRYTLAPFTATLSNLRKSEDKFFATVEALSFGQPFIGKARVQIFAGYYATDDIEAEFKEGMATISFIPKGSDGLSIRLTSLADSDLIANIPLPGTSYEQRQDDVVSTLGRVRTVSMVPSQNCITARGLSFSDGALGNTPIKLDTCVSKKVEISYATDIQDLVVVVREPVLGTTNVYEIGEVKKGKGFKIPFRSAIASVHIGAFVDGKPWEGHAVVVQPSKAQVSLKAPKKLQPGEILTIKLSAKKNSSVLLRVADKRMRVQEDAKTAVGTMLKRWMKNALSRSTTGDVITTPPASLRNDYYNITPAVFGANLDAAARWENTLGGNIGATWNATGFNYDANVVGRHALYYNQANDSLQLSVSIPKSLVMGAQGVMTGPRGVYGPRGTSGFSGFSGMSGFSGARGAAGPSGIAQARETDVDLIYSGLIEVNKEQTVQIQLPDCIGAYDITAFAVCKDDWIEVQHDLTVEKSNYLEPLIPQYAHADDEVNCVCYGVRGPKTKHYKVKVDGKEVTHMALQEGENVRVSWSAIPGLHEVTMFDESGKNEIDKIVRVVEQPGEETVMGQEIKILKPGEKYDIAEDDGAMQVKVMPSINDELKVAVSVCTNFEHYCCEQTSAMIVAACVAAMVSTDETTKEQAYQSIVKGWARLKAMYMPVYGFASYPGQSVNVGWSSAAARRVSNLSMVTSANLPDDAKRAIEDMVAMGTVVLSVHGQAAYQQMGAMESLYYKRFDRAVAQADIEKVMNDLSGANVYNYQAKSEAAFCAGTLIRNSRIEEGIKVANAVAKAMAGTLGGAMHGSYESLAYMHMIHEMRNSGVIAGGKSQVFINDKETTFEQAVDIKDISTVKAAKGACLLKIIRLSKIRFDEANAGVQMTLDLRDKHKSVVDAATIKAGTPVYLTVNLTSGYRDGDVLCVALPDCLSRIVAGTKTKKFQIDFTGRNQVQVELIAGKATKKGQRWAAVVRNMYDAARLGSVGLLTAEVK